MATSNVWQMNNDGWEDGLKNVFEPRKQADEEFKRGQGIIKDAYAIDEQQALLPTKLAESMVNRRKAEANLQYYEENPNALVDAIGSEYDKTRVVNENTIGENQAKITARNEQQAMEELIASKSVITTPEQLNPDGTVRVPATERPTTEIERLELAATAAPTYKMQQEIGVMVKAKYTDVVNQAVAQEDFVGAHEAAKKAGIITGDAKLTRLSDDTYTIQTTYGGTRQIGKQALQQMFFSQATKEKMAINNNEAAGRVELERQRRITSELDNRSREYVVNTQSGTARYVADVNAGSRIGAAEIRAGGTAQGNQGGGEAAFSRGGVAAKFSTKEGVTAKNLNDDFTSTLNELSTFLPDMVVTSADRKAGEAGNLGANSLHTQGRAADLRVTPQTTAFIKSEIGKNYFAQKGITVVEETSKEAMAKHGSTGPHYHLEYTGNPKQAEPTQNTAQAQPSGWAASRIRELTKDIPPTEQDAFNKYVTALSPAQQRILQFGGKEINADQQIAGIVSGYLNTRNKPAQSQPLTQQATPVTASSVPAMQQAEVPSVKASGTPDIPASQSTMPAEQLDPISAAFKETGVPELERMRNDLVAIQRNKGNTLEVRSLIGVIDEEIRNKTTSENFKQFKQDVADVGNGFKYIYKAYQDSNAESAKAKKAQGEQSRQNMLELLKGLKELEQARRK